MPQEKTPTHTYPPEIEAVSAEALSRLLTISRQLSSTLQLDSLLNLVMEVSTELTDTEVASILLVDERSGQLYFAASTAGAVPDNMVVPLDGSIAGWVVRHGRSLILQDVQSDDRFYANIDKDLQFVTHSMLAVPLVNHDKSIGALEVINKRGNAPYTAQDVALMEALASQSAVAIMNARLFQQSDLLAEIMHELKTPLMAIRSAGELLSRPELPPAKQAELVQMLKRESARLSKMTQDFLDFARLESGRAHLERQALDLGQIVQEVVRLVEPQAQTQGITIALELPDDLPQPHSERPLLGDADRLKQVLLNFVSNAVKYNVPNGRVFIRAWANEREVGIAIADTGRGIAPEDVPHLFERFYRVPRAEGVAEGSGLGLAIAKKIVAQFGGRVTVESTLGQGSTFTVYLPLAGVRHEE